MRQAWAIWLINLKQGANIKLNKERKLMKCNYNLIYTRESLWEKASIKFKRSMKLLLKDMAGLKKCLVEPKGGISAWVPNAK